jgi:hypothetical protein
MGLEDEQGGVELRADWYFDNRANPELKRAPNPFRPRPSPGMQQVRVKVWNKVFDRFEYLFEGKKATWEPIFSKDVVIRPPPEERELLRSLDLIPPEDNDWFLVQGFRSVSQLETWLIEKLCESLRRNPGLLFFSHCGGEKLRNKASRTG